MKTNILSLLDNVQHLEWTIFLYGKKTMSQNAYKFLIDQLVLLYFKLLSSAPDPEVHNLAYIILVLKY